MRKRCWKTVLSAILASAMLFTSVPTNLTMTVHAEELDMEDTLDDVNETEDEIEQENEDQTGNGAGETQDAQNPVGGTKVVTTIEDDGAETEAPDTHDSNAGNSGRQNTTKATDATTGQFVDEKNVTFTCVEEGMTWDDPAPETIEHIYVFGKGGGNDDWRQLLELSESNGVWTGNDEFAKGYYEYKFVTDNSKYESGNNRTFIVGLSDQTIKVESEKATELNAKINGTAVKYELSEETKTADTGNAITLEDSDGSQKITVGAAWDADKSFDLIATSTKDNSETCTVTVKVTAGGNSEPKPHKDPDVGDGQVTFYVPDDDYELVKFKGSMTSGGWATVAMELDSATGYWTLTYDMLPGIYDYGYETYETGDDLTKGGTWLGSEAGKVEVKNASGKVSPVITDKTVTFSYRAKTAKAVYVAGTMNGWDGSKPEESEYKLTKNESTDYWELTKEMSAGSYEYKFVADFVGDTAWLGDPLNPNKTTADDWNSTFVIKGLADKDVVLNRMIGKKELPSELKLFDETGDSSDVAVTYDLSEETKTAYNDAVKVSKDEKSGKAYVSITDKFPEDVTEFTLTATDANDNTSKVTVSIVDKTYKYTFYYYDPYPSHMDVKATDLWIWENGGSDGEAYPYTEKVTMEDGSEWLKAIVDVPYTDMGIIARTFNSWKGWQDEDRSYKNTEEKDEVTLYYVFGQDITETYPTELPEPVDEPDPRFLVVEYTRTAGTADWYFYTWNNGRVDMNYIEDVDSNGNFFIPFKDEDGDGTGTAIVPIGSGNESISFCLEKKSDKGHWAEQDGGDYLCDLPLDQTVVKIKVEGNKGITYVYPYNKGYEIDAKEGKINFYYRDDEAFLAGGAGGYADVSLELIAPKADINTKEASEEEETSKQTVKMTYDENEQRYEYVLEQLVSGDHYYRYGRKTTQEAETEYVLDKFNEETTKVGETEYSLLKYELLDVEMEAEIQNATMDYNDNNVLKIKINAKDLDGNPVEDASKLEIIEQATVDLSALGGGVLEIDPELLALSIAVKQGTSTGEKSLPITIKDIYGNEYKTEAKVTVVDRNKGSDFDWDEAVVYFAVTDRFFDGNASNNEGDAPGSYDKTTNGGLNSSYHGGDFAGLTQKLDYLQELGVNTIWITPIVENQTVANSVDNPTVTEAWGYTGYWAKDFTKLDSHLGTEAEFSALLDAAHAKGMKVMVDVVLNHTGYGTEITDYYNAYVKNEGDDPIRMLRSNDEVVSGSDQKSSLSGLPDFRTEDPEVRELVVEWQSNWISKYPIDYYRVDTVKHVDDTTWSAFKNALTEINPDFKMIGEWAGAGYATDTGMLDTGRMDALLDFDFPKQAANFAAGDLSGVEGFLSARNGAIDNTASLGSWLSNHDQQGFVHRLTSEKGKSEDEAKQLALVAASLQLTAKGQVYIYYGEEIGVSDGEENYPYQSNRRDFDWSKVTDDNEALAHYKKMLSIRNMYSELFAKGTRNTISADNANGLDVFTRSYGGTTLTVALNIKDYEQTYILGGQAPGTSVVDYYSGTSYPVDESGNAVIKVPAAADGGTVVLGTSNILVDLPTDAGMQVKTIPEQTYTGRSIQLSEDALQVYFGTTKLTAGQDYTVRYKNNKAVGTATAVIQGIGNYSDKETVQFNIIPKNIAETDVQITYKANVIANGREQKALERIDYNNGRLSEKDYKVEYYQLDSNESRISTALKGVKELGSYEMVITGQRNYVGTCTKKVQVRESGTYMSKTQVTIKGIGKKGIAYTGTEIKPEVEVKNSGVTVDPKCYDVKYTDNINVGTAQVIVTGNAEEGYYGSVTKKFNITGTALSSVAVVDTARWQKNVAFDVAAGYGRQPNAALKAKPGKKALTMGKDYTVSYMNNTKPGTATMIFTGAGEYTGSIKKTFKIMPIALTQSTDFEIQVAETAPFCKKGAMAKVSVSYKGRKLTEGKDYKLTYSNNKAVTQENAKKIPTVSITGMGAFSGSVKNAGTFKVVKADLSDQASGIKVTVADAVYADQAGKFMSEPVVQEADGTKLVKGDSKDYTVKYYVVENGNRLEKKQSDGPFDTGTVVEVEVTAAERSNYTGQVSKEYRIVQANLNDAVFIAKTQTYTGNAITLQAGDFKKAKLGGKPLVYGEDYRIVPGSYKNNVNRGTAELTVEGIGNFGGTKKVTFKIKSSAFRWWWNLFS